MPVCGGAKVAKPDSALRTGVRPQSSDPMMAAMDDSDDELDVSALLGPGAVLFCRLFCRVYKNPTHEMGRLFFVDSSLGSRFLATCRRES